MKKIKQFLVMLLVISLSITSLGSNVFAAGDFSSDAQNEQITDSSQNLNVEGTDSVGNMLASAISEENNNSEERKQLANNITGLEIEDNTAVVEFQTQTDAEVVVAVYDEQRVQMLASGNELVSQEESIATVTISGDMPQYFAATAYLLDADSHEPLCEAYNTELYTKNVQDLKNSTADDYDPDKVLQLDENNKKTNFAVFNEETTVADEGTDKNQLTDNGDGTYTITNADSSFTDLKVGETFSYNYEDGTVLLVKVADISVKGTTVTVRKDTDTDLTDYFDYVKIETDGVQEGWNVDNSNLEEGVTAADSEADTQALRIGGSGSSKYSTSWNIYKKLDENVKITGSFKYSFSFTIDVYITAEYQYLSVKNEYSAGIDVNITGTLKLKEIPLGRISTQPIICVKVELIPAFLVETSGSVTWSGEIKGSSGGAYDSNSGFKNLSSSPSCQSSLKVEGKIFMGVKVSPSVSIVDSDLANASLGFSGGAEITAAYSLYDTSKDELHECKKCLKGEVKSKLSMELTVKLIKGKVYRKRSYDLGTVKVGDFYYSIDYDEFGWTTCPHVCYPVKISVTDKDGKAIKGTSTVRVVDSKTGEAVEIRDKTSCMESVELTDSKETKVYLPYGSYVVHAENEEAKGEENLTVHDRGTQVIVKIIQIEITPVPTVAPNEPDAIQFGEYPQTKVNDKSVLYSALTKLENTTEDKIIIYNGKKYYYARDNGDFYQFDAIFWQKILTNETGTLLISDKILDNHTYGKINDMCVSWNNSDLRRWCNDEFLNMALTEKEQEHISVNTWYACDWGKRDSMVTEDKVSVPSHEMIAQLPLINQQVTGTDYSGLNNHSYYTSCTGSYFGVWNYPKWITENNEVASNYPANWSRGIRLCILVKDGSLTDKVEEQEVEISDDSISEITCVNDTETQSSELQTETPEFTDEVTTDSETDISIEPEEDIEKESEALEQSDITIEEDFGSGDFESDDVEVTEFTPPASNAQDDQFTGSSIMFSNRVPFSSCLFVMVKDEAAVNLLDASNLLYISQKDADETGTVVFRYILRESYESPVSEVFGGQIKDINDAAMTLQNMSYIYDGKAKLPEVTVKDDEVLLQKGKDYTVIYSNNVNAGKATVIVTGIGKYKGTHKLQFAISQAKPTLKFQSGTVSKRYGDKEFAIAFKEKKTDGKLLYSSSNTRVATVSTTGRIKITGMGSTVITVNCTGGKNYTAGKATFTVKVAKGKNAIIASSDINRNFSAKAQAVNIGARAYDKARLTYFSDNRAIKVNNAGRVTIPARFLGKCVITVKATATVHYEAAVRKITLRVNPLPTNITNVSNLTGRRAAITWKANKYVTGYLIQYSTDSKFKKNVGKVAIGRHGTTKTILSKLTKGKTYYIRIQTYKQSGNVKVYSAWSKVRSVKVKK